MEDGFERRALLTHLGDVLEVMARVLKSGGNQKNIRQLIQEDAALVYFPILDLLPPQMTAQLFAQYVGAAFFAWPGELLKPELDRHALALSVQQNLFAGNPDGWQAYIAQMKIDVPWFGDGVPVPELEPSSIAPARLEKQAAPESPGLYPSWPWRA